ncbi:MAG TPA: YafY family protein [Streptosporangiaceae bacterium]|nr:YafY family protein [Streptosporangiaceae bacterium]
MLDTSARLLRLLSLLQARPDWPGPDLAARLAITPRTLRRDIQRLRDLGYPVHATPGVAGGYRLAPGATLPPLLLTDDEAVAVAVSLQTAASQSVTGIAETSLSALAKLEQVLPARLRERTRALQQATVTLPRIAPTVDPALLTTLATACRHHHTLAFTYTTRQGEETRRLAEPHRLVHTGYRWYLVARDTARDDWRTFRADRIRDPHPAGTRFVPRNPPDAASFVALAVTTAPYRHQARVLIHAPVATVAEQITPTTGILEEAGPDQCLLTAGSDSLEAMAFHLAAMPHACTILGPPELIETARAMAARLSRSAELPRPTP